MVKLLHMKYTHAKGVNVHTRQIRVTVGTIDYSSTHWICHSHISNLRLFHYTAGASYLPTVREEMSWATSSSIITSSSPSQAPFTHTAGSLLVLFLRRDLEPAHKRAPQCPYQAYILLARQAKSELQISIASLHNSLLPHSNY